MFLIRPESAGLQKTVGVVTSRIQGPFDFIMASLATGFGSGMAPYMPGTFGTLVGLPIAWCLETFGNRPITQIVACIVLFLVGIPICSQGERIFGRKDPGEVVWDEIAAMPLVYLFVPFTLVTCLVGFVWFRVFDISKPWPVKKLESIGGGFGIMADDTIAALMAAGTTWITMLLIPV